MNFEPAFRVHLADCHGFADNPFIVTAVYPTAAGLRSEWFLVVPEDKGMLFAQRSTLDLNAFPDSRLLKFDEDLLFSEALDQARLRLRRYILEKKESSAQLLLATGTTAQPSDANHLVKLWMRGSYCGCLSEIRAKSECVPLVETLVGIHGLPMLASESLQERNS